MELTELSLTNCRSYRSLSLHLDPGLTVLCGDNGQGKTNLLEAIYLLALGKSYRVQSERDLVSWEAADAGGYAIIAGTVRRANGRYELRVGLDCSGGGAGAVQKRVRVNGVPKRTSDLVGVLNAVLFSAEDIDLVFGSPAGRRRYLDVLLSQTSRRYVRALQRYQRVLTQRNHILRGIKEGRSREDELLFWDAELSREGGDILAARWTALARLAPLAAAAFVRLSGAEAELGVEYAATAPVATAPHEGVAREAMAAALERTRTQERAMAMTLAGPHRDDLRLTLGGIEMPRHASRGQARLTALALRLAEAELLRELHGDAPVVLLDDILSELDVTRRALVLEEAASYPQTVLTTADPGLVPPAVLSAARFLRIEAGEVLEEALA